MVIHEGHLRRWSIGLLAFTAVLVALSTIFFHTSRFSAWTGLYSYFYVGSELGIAAYWNAGLLAIVSFVSLLSGLLARVQRVRCGWFVVASVTLFLSLDEATQLHEKTARLVPSIRLPTFTWVIVGIPLAVLLILILWAATRPLAPQLRHGLAAALLLYILGALGFEALSGMVYREDVPVIYNVLATIEETLEITACILAIHVTARALLPLQVLQGWPHERALHRPTQRQSPS